MVIVSWLKNHLLERLLPIWEGVGKVQVNHADHLHPGGTGGRCRRARRADAAAVGGRPAAIPAAAGPEDEMQSNYRVIETFVRTANMTLQSCGNRSILHFYLSPIQSRDSAGTDQKKSFSLGQTHYRRKPLVMKGASVFAIFTHSLQRPDPDFGVLHNNLISKHKTWHSLHFLAFSRLCCHSKRSSSMIRFISTKSTPVCNLDNINEFLNVWSLFLTCWWWWSCRSRRSCCRSCPSGWTPPTPRWSRARWRAVAKDFNLRHFKEKNDGNIKKSHILQGDPSV